MKDTYNVSQYKTKHIFQIFIFPLNNTWIGKKTIFQYLQFQNFTSFSKKYFKIYVTFPKQHF